MGVSAVHRPLALPSACPWPLPQHLAAVRGGGRSVLAIISAQTGMGAHWTLRLKPAPRGLSGGQAPPRPSFFSSPRGMHSIHVTYLCSFGDMKD